MKDGKERFERLERENMRMRERLHRLEAMLGLVEGHVPEEVSAARFLVRDAEGRARASLGLSDFGPELQIFDRAGTLRARLGMLWEGEPEGEHGPGLTLFDAQRRPLASLLLGLDGEGALGPVLTLSVPGDQPARLVLGAGRNGSLLSLHDRGGLARALLRVRDEEGGSPELTLRPGAGPDWSAP